MKRAKLFDGCRLITHASLRLLLSEKFARRGVCFLIRLLFQLLIDAPVMAKRIENLAVTRAPKHVLHRHQDLRAACDGALDDAVRIASHQRDAHAGAAEGLWGLTVATFFASEFIADEKLVTIKLYFTMHQALAVRRHHIVAFFGAENFSVELQRGQAVAHNQMRNKLIFLSHENLLFPPDVASK